MFWLYGDSTFSYLQRQNDYNLFKWADDFVHIVNVANNQQYSQYCDPNAFKSCLEALFTR